MTARSREQRLVNAAVAELRSQLGEDGVRLEGTRVHVEDTFKMARVIEAVMNVALSGREPEIIATAVRYLTLGEANRFDPEDMAADLLLDVQGIILDKLDPLP